jgi:inorganic pyrophosphatase
VIGQLPVVPLSIMRVRPIGVINMLDQGKQDDKIIAIHLDDPEYSSITKFSELRSHKTSEIRHFFQHYKELENKTVEMGAISSEQTAISIIQAAIELYQRTFKA